MAKVYITDSGFTQNDAEYEVLGGAGHTVELLQTRDPQEIIRRASDADALMVQWATISRPVFEALKNLKVISRYGIGVDSLDLEAAKDHGVTVVNCPDYCLDEVSDTAMAFILASARQVIPLADNVRASRWNMAGVGAMHALSSQTLGLIGFGAIGRRVAAKARGFGIRLLIADPVVDPATVSEAGATLVSLDRLLAESDYVSLHTPATPATHHIINKLSLAKMKPGSVLINTARGALVDTAALTNALASGHLAAAYLDVLEVEPPSFEMPLWKLPNIFVHPHTASVSDLSVPRLQRAVTEDVARVLAGEQPRWRVV